RDDESRPRMAHTAKQQGQCRQPHDRHSEPSSRVHGISLVVEPDTLTAGPVRGPASQGGRPCPTKTPPAGAGNSSRPAPWLASDANSAPVTPHKTASTPGRGTSAAVVRWDGPRSQPRAVRRARRPGAVGPARGLPGGTTSPADLFHPLTLMDTPRGPGPLA